jgi:hypothetical protein
MRRDGVTPLFKSLMNKTDYDDYESVIESVVNLTKKKFKDKNEMMRIMCNISVHLDGGEFKGLVESKDESYGIL